MDVIYDFFWEALGHYEGTYVHIGVDFVFANSRELKRIYMKGTNA